MLGLQLIFLQGAIQPIIVIKFRSLTLNKFMNKYTSFLFPSRYTIQTISLVNPTHETLKLQVRSSNPFNFVLETHKPPVSIFRKSSILLLSEHFPIMILRHCGILAFQLLIRFQMSKI